MCTLCFPGFVALQSGTWLANAPSTNFILNCVACTDNCATCAISTSTCISCIGGYTLSGTNCISNFNFQVQATLGVTLAVFTNNYVTFINAIAKAAGVPVQNILVQSIVSGSVTVNMQVSTTSPAGSTAAVNAQNSLGNLLAQGNTIAGMSVTSSSISTNGGDNNPSGGGLSTTTIIILATVIPIGTLRIYFVI